MSNEPHNSAARKLHASRHKIASGITDKQFQDQGQLEQGYGEYGRQKCYEDALYHLNYLVEALRLESPKIFNTYIEWTVGLLQARGISRQELVDQLHHLQEACMNILDDNLHEFVDFYLAHGLETLEKKTPPVSTSLIRSENPLHEEARNYLNLLLQSKQEQATTYIQTLVDRGTSVRDIYQYIFTVTQREIGRLWYIDKISVAKEHYATAATRKIMGKLTPYFYGDNKTGRKLMASTVSSDLHEMGLRMITDNFEMEGWDTYYIGGNIPPRDLIQALKEQRPHLLALSITLPHHVSEGKDLIRYIRLDEQVRNLPIIVGGYPFGLIENLWKRIGADGTAHTVEEALELGSRLVPA